MTRQQALTRLRKILGPKLGYRVDETAPSADEREEAQQKQRQLNQAKTDAETAMQERRVAVLAQDQEYQRLKAVWQAAKDAASSNAGKLYCYKFTVGITSNVAGFPVFSIKAQGDSWEQIFIKLSNAQTKGDQDDNERGRSFDQLR